MLYYIILHYITLHYIILYCKRLDFNFLTFYQTCSLLFIFSILLYSTLLEPILFYSILSLFYSTAKINVVVVVVAIVIALLLPQFVYSLRPLPFQVAVAIVNIYFSFNKISQLFVSLVMQKHQQTSE